MNLKLELWPCAITDKVYRKIRLRQRVREMSVIAIRKLFSREIVNSRKNLFKNSIGFKKFTHYIRYGFQILYKAFLLRPFCYRPCVECDICMLFTWKRKECFLEQ